MGILRKASTETKKLDLNEDEYLIVLADISKRDFNRLASQMPTKAEGENLTVEEATGFAAQLFGALVVGWSLSDGKPTVEDYEELSAEAGNAVDSLLVDHFQSLMPTSAEGK
jgi:hypothetical protein